MADSDGINLTEQERKLIQDILTRVWLSMDWNKDTGRYEANNIADAPHEFMSRKEMNELANAISKI